MLVKCRLCGKKIDKEDAFQAPTGGGRFYFCNEEEAKIKEEEKRKKIEEQVKIKEESKQRRIDPVYEEVASIFGYRIQNSTLFKEMKLWRELCDDEKILAYLQENKDYITNAVSRLDSSEFAKIRYFSAILKNSLKDFSVQVRACDVEPVKIEADFEMYEPIVSSKRKRRGLSDIEDEV